MINCSLIITGASRKVKGGGTSVWRRLALIRASFLVKRIDFARQIGLEIRMQGEVAERLKAPDWKSCIQLKTVSRVRIPLSPPDF